MNRDDVVLAPAELAELRAAAYREAIEHALALFDTAVASSPLGVPIPYLRVKIAGLIEPDVPTAGSARAPRRGEAGMSAKPVVYVSGSYTRDPVAGTRAAIRLADELWRIGAIPLVPHLSLLVDLVAPRPYEAWLEIDLALVERCDALIRIPGESKGADREEAHARELGLPVFVARDVTNVEFGLWVRHPETQADYAKALKAARSRAEERGA